MPAFAAATYRTGAVARAASTLLGLGALVQAIGMVILLNDDWGSPRQVLMLMGMAAFALGR